MVMELRVAVVCLVIVLALAEDTKTEYYKTDIKPLLPVLDDQKSEKTEEHGFVTPLDFSSFAQFIHGSSHNAFQSLPFTAGEGFDFFGEESRDSGKLQLPGGDAFAEGPFGNEKENQNGFVQPVKFTSAFNDGEAAPSNAIFRPRFRPSQSDSPSHASQPQATKKHDLPSGKSNYPAPSQNKKSEHSPSAVYADSEDVEVFFPPGKAILPQINGRPKPYDGYRAASEVEGRVAHSRAKNDEVESFEEIDGPPRPYDGYVAASAAKAVVKRSADVRNDPRFRNTYQKPTEAKFRRKVVRQEQHQLPEDDGETEAEEVQEAEEEEEDDEEEAQEEPPKRKSSGYKYKYDNSLKIPDLIIKKYPYEQEADNDKEYTHAYEEYKKTLPTDLEKHFGTPDFSIDYYSKGATENLEQDKNCQKVEPKEGDKQSQTCYTCKNPKTGGSYEQCAYEEEPKSKKYVYGGSTSSSHAEESKPVKYRYRRDLDYFQPSGYEYFVYNDDPALKRKARAEEKIIKPKRKTKKYNSKLKKTKKQKRQPRQQKEFDPSSNIEGPPESYEGPKYTYEGPEFPYEGPSSPYEGPSSPYEGPRSPYEGPRSPYEGPDHDDYYDRTDDRIPYKTNKPLTSSFFSDSEQKKRQRRGPKSEIEEFEPSKGYFSDYRFGPEFFDGEQADEKPEPTKRNTKTQSVSTDTEFFPGNVKIFKNGDVCEKAKKKDMICMICNNDKTGAKYEQCQFSSNPNKKQYSYGSQKSFSSNKPEKERPQRQVKYEEPGKFNKKVMITKVEQKKLFNEGNEPLFTEESQVTIRRQRETEDTENVEGDEKENIEDEGEDDKSEAESENLEARDGIEGLDIFLADDKSEDTYPKESETYEEYFKRVFPEFEVYGKLTPETFDPFSDLEEFRQSDPTDKAELITYEPSESVQNPKRLKDQSGIPRQFFDNDDEDSKKNLRRAFETFKSRDWSKCKKMQKDKLVCYTCTDENGIKNEECMYVEGAEPVSSHMAYHEKKDFDPAASNIEAHTNFTTTEPPSLSKRADNNTETEVLVPTKLKGDFEGVPKLPKTVETTTQSFVRKRKFPVKKYNGETTEAQDKIAQWESGKQVKKDDGVVKIFFNITEPALKA